MEKTVLQGLLVDITAIQTKLKELLDQEQDLAQVESEPVKTGVIDNHDLIIEIKVFLKECGLFTYQQLNNPRNKNFINVCCKFVERNNFECFCGVISNVVKAINNGVVIRNNYAYIQECLKKYEGQVK